MGKRDMLPIISDSKALEPEIIECRPVPLKQNNELEAIHTRNRYDLARTAMASLPAVIELAREIVALKNMEKKTQLEMDRLQQQCDLLKAEAKNFALKEQEHRATIATRGQQATNILKQLTEALQSANIAPEVQSELIAIYGTTIKEVCGGAITRG